jgi:hypothetical protein
MYCVIVTVNEDGKRTARGPFDDAESAGAHAREQGGGHQTAEVLELLEVEEAEEEDKAPRPRKRAAAAPAEAKPAQ